MSNFSNNSEYPFLTRRLGAIFYDTLLVLAILIIGTALLLIFTRGRAVNPGNIYYQAFLIFMWFSFITSFWAYGGQTAGMAAWRLRVVTLTNDPLSIQQALWRLTIAVPCCLLGGAGLFWSLWDKNRMTLYDKLSKTKLIIIETVAETTRKKRK